MPSERRITPRECRLKGDGKTLSGYAALYGVESRDMGYTEIIEPGAFTRSLADDDDVLALYEHDQGRLLGRRSAGTLRLNEDKRGLAFELDLDDEIDLHKSIKRQVARGDLADMSFAFGVNDNGEDWNTDDGKRTRRLTSLRLYDVSVVAEPAYPQTSVAVRSAKAMNENERYAEIRRLTTEMRGILDSDMGAEDEQQYDRLSARLETLESEARTSKRRDALARVDAWLDEPTAVAPVPSTATASETDRSSRAYSEAFHATICGRGTMEQRNMLAGSGNGANVVPDEMEASILALLDAPTSMRAICTVTAARGNREIPVESAIGSGGWVAEASALTAADVTLAQKTASPKIYGSGITYSTLLQAQSGVAGIDAYLGRAVGRRLASGIEAGYVTGTGSSNQPEGLITALGTANDIGTLAGDDVVDMALGSNAPASQYRVGGRWLMNDTMLASIRKLKDSNDQYLWKVSENYSDIRDGVPGTLMGYPVTIVPDMADTDVVFGNVGRAYRIFDWGGTTVLADPYTSASSGLINLWSYRATDGVLVDSSAVSYFQTS